ncbi:MAG: lysophospholipid acyltransferase family protein [Polyangiaceae bacterium]|jgi:KDO2-lipid IV(A) lauroyltransferase|nr:lysophospholipid acyltransferase family protein [Polyangiaceae bacterium]
MVWRVLAWVVGRVPWVAVGWLGAVLGFLVGRVLRIRRRHVVLSMQRAGLVEAEVAADRMYRSLGTGVFELLWTAAHPHEDLGAVVSIDARGWREVEAALGRGRGLVVATAHTGNWDLVACAVAARVPLTVVTKHLHWRSLDAFWQRLRNQRGVRLVNPEGAVREAGRTLRSGGVMAFLIDQAPLRRRGVLQAPFLGEPADHDCAFATIAARHRAPLAVAFGERLEDGTHHVRVPLVRQGAQEQPAQWSEQAVRETARVLEQFVRERPSQWLWLHRRWRRGGELN